MLQSKQLVCLKDDGCIRKYLLYFQVLDGRDMEKLEHINEKTADLSCGAIISFIKLVM